MSKKKKILISSSILLLAVLWILTHYLGKPYLERLVEGGQEKAQLKRIAYPEDIFAYKEFSEDVYFSKSKVLFPCIIKTELGSMYKNGNGVGSSSIDLWLFFTTVNLSASIEWQRSTNNAAK